MPTKTLSKNPPNQVTSTGEPAQEEEPELSYEEYEQRRIELIAKLPPKSERPKYLIDKLALVTGLVGEIKKSGKNTFHNYRYAKESDLVEAIRPLLAELGIRIHQSLYGEPELGFIAHQRLSQTKRKDGQIVGESDSLTAITMVFWFEHVNDGKVEKTEQQIFMGYGDDNSDKGIYKAFTGCEKYFLMKTFLVATGDDPEGDQRADQRAARRDEAPRIERSQQQGGRAQPRHGGRQQESSSPQLRQLGELLRQAGLASSSAKALEYFGEVLERPFPVEDGDPAGTLVDVTKALKPEEMGKLIASLRAKVEGDQAPQEATDAVGDGAAAEVDVDAAVEPAPEAAADEEEDAGPIA